MLGPKTNSSKALVIETAVSRVLREQERMMNLMISPEGHTVFMIFPKLLEDWFVFHFGLIVGVKAYEEELCCQRMGALIWLLPEKRVQQWTWMCIEHTSGD